MIEENTRADQCGRKSGASSNAPPWLGNAHWRRREVRYVHGIGFAVFVLVGIVSTGIAFPLLAHFWARRPLPGPEGFVEGSGAWFAMMLLSVLLLSPAVWAAYGLWRRIRFGESVCRIRTLPGVIGGWFKADVECRLPGHSNGTVKVWLINGLHKRRDQQHLLAGSGKLDHAGFWAMSQSIEVTVTPGERTVISVRLKVPRDPAQAYRRPDGRLTFPTSRMWVGDPPWLLVVLKRNGGINYRAMFSVPVFDTSDAPASEQRAE